MYLIQPHDTKCVSDLRNVTGFLFVLIFVTSHGQVYSIQPYEIKCVSDLRNVTGFLFVLIFSLPMVRCT